MRRLRGTSKAPFAVAGILSVPLFFVALMAFTLKIDKPSHFVRKDGTIGLGDPTKGTIGTIYLLAFAVGRRPCSWSGSSRGCSALAWR